MKPAAKSNGMRARKTCRFGLALLAGTLLPGGGAWAQDISVPSGKTVTFHEVIWNEPGYGLTYRFRFISPEIASPIGTVDYEAVERDMAQLCQDFALPRLADTGPQPNMIVISIADKVAEFGQPAPDTVQIFEAYSITDNTCIWEPL